MKKGSDDRNLGSVEGADVAELGPEGVVADQFIHTPVDVGGQGVALVVVELGADHEADDDGGDDVVKPDRDADAVVAATPLVVGSELGGAVDAVEHADGLVLDGGKPRLDLGPAPALGKQARQSGDSLDGVAADGAFELGVGHGVVLGSGGHELVGVDEVEHVIVDPASFHESKNFLHFFL